MPPTSPLRKPEPRLLLTPPLPGAVNMALDELLLERAVADGPTLRVYDWLRPTLTLGYGQPADDLDLAACATHGVDVTRRLTGGRAVLHHLELTYSVAVPAELVGGLRSITQAYALLSAGVSRGLAQLGLEAVCQPRSAARPAVKGDPACFAAALGGDLSVDGRKLVGSAQCHRHEAVLQHGSIPLDVDLELLNACLHRPVEATAGWTCLAEHGLAPTAKELAAALAAGFAPWLGTTPVIGAPTDTELADAESLAARKYGHPDWVLRL